MAKETSNDKQVIYSMVRVSKTYPPNNQVIRDISLSYFYGAKIGVLGLNGSGKSTLLRIMAGVEKEFNGETILAPGYTIGYLEQEPQLDNSKTVRQVVEEGVQETVDALAEFDAINARFGEDLSPDEMDELMARQAEVQDKLDALNAWDLDSRLELAMDALRCPPGETPVAVLSGGERRRVALCRLLLQEPDILLLDEPTNHLDAESVAWLENHLHTYAGTIIAVTHDRYFLDNVAGWILELDRGYGIPWKGNYSSWLEQKRQRLAHMVIQAEDLAKAFGDNLLYENLSFDMPPGAIVGIIGPNGAGKTTLFRMIVGQEQPDAGALTVGSTVKLAYVDQSRDDLAPDKTVWEEISEGNEQIRIGERLVNSRAYVARFAFAGTDQQKKVGALSGGERNRVHLAKMLKSGANVLLLDEPSNDLDVNTLRALEDALESFAGSVLVISHDRWFLDRIATHILAFEGDSQVVWFPGNYSEYAEDRRRRLGPTADRPHRITYRKLRRA